MSDVIAEPVHQVACDTPAANEEQPIKKTPSTGGDDAAPSTLDGLVISPLTNRHESNGPAPELPANQKQPSEVDGSVPSRQPAGEEEVTFKENARNNLNQGSEPASAEPPKDESEPAAAPQEASNGEPQSEPAPPSDNQQPHSDAQSKLESEGQGAKDDAAASGEAEAKSKQDEEKVGPGQVPADASEAGEAKIKDQQASDASSESAAASAEASAAAADA